jgi:hypothetical protein
MVRPFMACCAAGGSADPGRLAAGDVTASALDRSVFTRIKARTRA